jgi:hypothetical protein
MEWVLKSNINLQFMFENMIPLQFASNKYSKSWTVISNTKNEEAPPDAQDQLDGWDFDDGIVLETQIAMPLEQSGSMGLCFSLNFILAKAMFGWYRLVLVVVVVFNTSKLTHKKLTP